MDESSAISANYTAFSERVPEMISENFAEFRGHQKLIQSYARIAAINALKVELVARYYSPGAAEFFYEAHNDLLISHVNASFGSWRPALQSLRSFMENSLAALYYSDHPVELEKWSKGKFSITPRELREYASEHPLVEPLSGTIAIKKNLDQEYATLSKAVHGSSSLFRMTNETGKTSLATVSKADLGKWSTRECSTVDVCATVFCAALQGHLDGAKLPNLREAIGKALLKNSRAALRKHSSIIVS